MPAEIELTEELTQQICDLLATMPMSKICKLPYMPSASTIQKWYALHPDFHERCRRARDLCADNTFEEHTDIINDLRAGVIEPETARVLLNGLQWKIMQLDKARYGDKPNKLTITNNTDNRRVDVTFETLKLASPDILASAKRQVIEATQTHDKHTVVNADEDEH